MPQTAKRRTTLSTHTTYDVAIIGGGLAGLALSIQLAAKGWQVVLLEKETYPFHRVCGEYISMESWDFLCSLGLPLEQWQLPIITRLQVTAPNGRSLETNLPLGGFGVSRYKLDAAMAAIAVQQGVHLFTGTRVEAVTQQGEEYTLSIRGSEGAGQVRARVCCGSWGKRSNMDVKWKRPFVEDRDTRLANHVGIKYHVRTQWPADLIGLHNFKDGYCGISQVEEGVCCLCYLTRAANLKAEGQSVQQLEASVLSRNPMLKKILEASEKLPGFPLAISQVSFRSKSQVEQGVLLLGDAAGMITPLCGNGMSMALHGSKLAAGAVHLYLTGTHTRDEMEAAFTKLWQARFGSRLRTGRILQTFFGSEQRSNLLVSVMNRLPFATRALIRQTHGAPF